MVGLADGNVSFACGRIANSAKRDGKLLPRGGYGYGSLNKKKKTKKK